MSDVKLIPTKYGYDISLNNDNEIELVNDFTTEIVMAVGNQFAPTGEKAHWWGQSLIDGVLGSQLRSILQNGKKAGYIASVEDTVRNALQYLIDNSIASGVEVDATENASTGDVNIDVSINGNNIENLNLRYVYNWDAQTVEIV